MASRSLLSSSTDPFKSLELVLHRTPADPEVGWAGGSQAGREPGALLHTSVSQKGGPISQMWGLRQAEALGLGDKSLLLP